MLTNILQIILLCLFWYGLSGLPDSYIKFCISSALVSASLLLAFRLDINSPKSRINLYAFGYIYWLMIEIFKSSINLIKIIISPKIKIDDGFEWLNSLQRSELGLVIYANSITLTPGTITVKVENNKLLVHFLARSSIYELQDGEMADKVKKITESSAI